MRNKTLNLLSDKVIVILIFVYTFCLLLFSSHMSPLYYSNEWTDVNVYHNIGKAIFNGKTLYTEVFDHKGPLIFFIYGLGYLISGDSFLGMFLIELLGWFIMVYYIYRLSGLYLDKAGAYLVAIVLPVFLTGLMKAGGSAEEFVLIFECVSLYYFVRYFKEKDASNHHPYAMFLHGVMCSMVFFTKLNLVIFWFFPLAGIFLNLIFKKKYRNFILNMLAFWGGFFVIAIPICLYLYINDALGEAYAIYIELNRQYASVQTTGKVGILLLVKILFLFLAPLSLALMYLAGVFYFPLKYIRNKIGKYALVLSGISLYVVTFMSLVYQYYYPIPFLAFSALGVLGIVLYIVRYIKIGVFSFKYVLLFTVIVCFAGLGQKSLTDTRMGRPLTGYPGLLTQKMHQAIVREKDPTLLNLSFGLGNSLFTTCHIIPSVRYFVSPNLAYSVYPEMRDEQEKYIKNKEVQFIVLSLPPLDNYQSSVVWRRESTYDYFMNLSAFKENYSLILTDTIINTIDEGSLEIYALYKRND